MSETLHSVILEMAIEEAKKIFDIIRCGVTTLLGSASGRMCLICEAFQKAPLNNKHLVEVLSGMTKVKEILMPIKKDINYSDGGKILLLELDKTIELYEARLAAARVDVRVGDRLVIKSLSSVEKPFIVFEIQPHNDADEILFEVSTVIQYQHDHPLILQTHHQRLDSDGQLRPLNILRPTPATEQTAMQPLQVQGRPLFLQPGDKLVIDNNSDLPWTVTEVMPPLTDKTAALIIAERCNPYRKGKPQEFKGASNNDMCRLDPDGRLRPLTEPPPAVDDVPPDGDLNPEKIPPHDK